MLLYDILGGYGVGGRHIPPSTSIFIQPIDLIMRTQGIAWNFSKDAALEWIGMPWSG